MQSFRDLKVWQKAHGLTLEIYRLTHSFPREELYGLTSQIRRSAASVGANIAEGCGRGSGRELRQFLQVARGSASEVEYHILLARDLHFLTDSDYSSVATSVTEIKRMLTGLIGRVQPNR